MDLLKSAVFCAVRIHSVGEHSLMLFKTDGNLQESNTGFKRIDIPPQKKKPGLLQKKPGSGFECVCAVFVCETGGRLVFIENFNDNGAVIKPPFRQAVVKGVAGLVFSQARCVDFGFPAVFRHFIAQDISYFPGPLQ